MRIFFKYLSRTILAILLLPVFLVLSVYFPPVQRMLKNKALDYVTGHYGVVVRAEQFRLGFPLRLTLKNVYAGWNETDTLAAVGSLHLRVGLDQVFRHQLSVNEMELRRVHLNLAGDSAGMELRVRLQEAALRVRSVDLWEHSVDAEFIRLGGGDVYFRGGESEADDTTDAAPSDWKFMVGEVGLRQLSYRMEGADSSFLGAGLDGCRLVRGEVDLGRQSVDADSLYVTGAWCSLVTADGGTPETEQEGLAESGDLLPWTVQIAAVQLDNGAFRLDGRGEKPVELMLSGIGVMVDSVYNRGPVVRARFKDLVAVQQGGVAVTSMQAGMVLDSAKTSLNGVFIRTPNSLLRAEINADTSMQELFRRMPLSVALEGWIGVQDLVPYLADLPEEIRDRRVELNTVLSVSGERIKIGQLLLSMSEKFRLTGSGTVSSYRVPRKMSGSLTLRGEIADVDFARHYMDEWGIYIPRNLDLQLNMKAGNGILSSLFTLYCGGGKVSLDAAYNFRQESYEAEVALNGFPLGRFFPDDSLGMVTAGIRLGGRGLTFAGAEASLDAHIRGFEFMGHDYHDIALAAALNRACLRGSLTSGDPDLPMDLVFHGDTLGKDYRATLGGRLGIADLERLHFVRESLQVGSVLDITATFGSASDYTLKAVFDSLEVSDGTKKYHLGMLNLGMHSDLSNTVIGLDGGDLKLHFRTDTSFSAFTGNAGKIVETFCEQIRERNVDMEVVKAGLPPFTLHIEGARDNAVAGFLKSEEVEFKNIKVDVVSRRRSGIRLGVAAAEPHFGSVRLDSVQFGVWQTGKSLMFSFSAGSSAEAWKGLLNVNVNGRMQGDRFRMELVQQDAEGRTGFDLGLNLLFGDTTVTASVFPTNPVLGYSRWFLNRDNRIVIGAHGGVRANLRAAYLHKLISLQSLPDMDDMRDRMQIEIAGLDLASLSQTMPFMPQISGILNTDLCMYTKDSVMGADGSIGIGEFGYGQQRVGTVDMGLHYSAENDFTRHSVDLDLRIDSVRRISARGDFAGLGQECGVTVDVDIPSLPLYLANVFISRDLIGLTGDMTGKICIRGTLDEPEIDGSLALEKAEADVVMLGTTFKLDTAVLPVRNGKVVFDRYRFIARNNSDLVVDGNINLTPFDRMGVDLSLRARNFEAVNVKKNDVSLIYGKAYVNINSRISGSFSDLSMTGKVNLLNTTAITYTLRSSELQQVDRSENLLRFVSFRDSILNGTDEFANHIDPGGFDMRMQMEIGDQVRFGVELSEDGSNHVDIQGGGNLVLTMNPESDLVLSGKYILTDGTVVYNVPVVGKKEFSIRNGSYIEWTGKIMNPILSISASESVKADVNDGEQTRQVAFEVIIRIDNTLTRPNITFDLSVPNDLVIQNQLATFSQEERTGQALNLLIYNTYTAPGTAESGGGGNMAGNAIQSLVENELNKYTRRAGLTVGFDWRNTGENTTRTDVTYQFSRQLFNDRIRVKIGGRISMDSDVNEGDNLQDNIVDDISIEYMLTKMRNLYIKVFRHSNYDSVLDGEVTQTGLGIVWRKNFRKFKDLFKNRNREEKRKAEMLRMWRLNAVRNDE